MTFHKRIRNKSVYEWIALPRRVHIRSIATRSHSNFAKAAWTFIRLKQDVYTRLMTNLLHGETAQSHIIRTTFKMMQNVEMKTATLAPLKNNPWPRLSTTLEAINDVFTPDIRCISWGPMSCKTMTNHRPTRNDIICCHYTTPKRLRHYTAYWWQLLLSDSTGSRLYACVANAKGDNRNSKSPTHAVQLPPSRIHVCRQYITISDWNRQDSNMTSLGGNINRSAGSWCNKADLTLVHKTTEVTGCTPDSKRSSINLTPEICGTNLPSPHLKEYHTRRANTMNTRISQSLAFECTAVCTSALMTIVLTGLLTERQ